MSDIRYSAQPKGESDIIAIISSFSPAEFSITPMRIHKSFQNFIDAFNCANSLELDRNTKTKIQKQQNKWTLFVYNEIEPEYQQNHVNKNIIFNRIIEDVEFVKNKNIKLEDYYNFLPIDDLLVRVKDNNILLIDKINLIKEIIVSRYLQRTQEDIQCSLKNSRDSTEKTLLVKALKIIKEKNAIQKKELVSKLKDLELELSNLSFEEITKRWNNCEEEGFPLG